MIGWFNTPNGPTFPELITQGLSSVEGGYDRLSAKFDQSVFRTPDPVLEGLHQQFFECRTALDIGCGTGAVMQRLQPFAHELVGLDLSSNMLAVARQHLGPGPRLIQGDFLQTYWENYFQLITCVGVLGHIAVAHQDLFFERVFRALSPGGVFLTVVGRLSGRPWVYLPALAFDSLMRLRNLLWRPPFVMYYLSFVLPKAAQVVERQGLQVEVIEANFPPPFRQLVILRATKPGT